MTPRPKTIFLDPLPPGVLPALPDRSAIDQNFASGLREWRQSRDGAQRRRLWDRLVAMASAGRSAPNPFASSHRGPSALYEAVASGCLACMDLIALADSSRGQMAERINEAGIDGDRPRSISSGELHTILSYCWLGAKNLGGTSAPMIRKLAALGAHPDGSALDPGAPLRGCVAMGDVDGAKALIELGADPRRPLPSEFGDGDALLHYAMRCRDLALPMHAMLVEHGCDPHALNAWGQTPMQTAMETYASIGNIDFLRQAIALGGHPSLAPATGGGTLLHAALAAPDAARPDAKGPISAALAMHGYLMELGIDRRAKDRSGATALQQAHRHHHAWTQPLMQRDEIDAASAPAILAQPSPRL